MLNQPVKIIGIEPITHDVKRFVTTKPAGYRFKPGQATEVAINLPAWENKKRPFTFTGLNRDPNLEFIIKGYFDHRGVTQKIHRLKTGSELLIGQPRGTITYRGPGVFLAGGSGITSFVAIFRELKSKDQLKENLLIFSNKSKRDIILENELKKTFKTRVIFTLTRQGDKGYRQGRIDRRLLKKEINNFRQNFYLCGPEPFVNDLRKLASGLGANTQDIIFEK